MRFSTISKYGRRGLVAASLAAMIITIFVSDAAAQNDPVFDTKGFQPDRAVLGFQPFEHFDTVTGNMILTFTDLTLPGNAGFDVTFVRTYNSRTGEWRFGVAGIPLYLVSDPSPQPQLLDAVTFFTADGSGHRPEVAAGPDVKMTREFWIFNKTTRTLSMPNGLVATYDPSGDPYTCHISEVHDPFGNSLTFQWNPLGGPESVTQLLGNNQSRTVTFQYADGRVQSMSYLGRTWTYTWDDPALNYNDLLSVVLPAGPRWQYHYTTFSGPLSTGFHSMDVVTTPNGGTINYALTRIDVERPAPLNTVNAWVLSSRSTGGRAPASSPWTFTYGSQTTHVYTPSAHLQFQWLDRNNQAVQWTRWVWDGNVLAESETLLYDDISLGSLLIPVVRQRTLERDGRTFTTTYTYSTNNNGDWGHPSTIQETGEISRTTTLTYRHNFSNYIRGRLASSSSGGFTRSYTYDDDTGFLTAQTVYGVETDFAPDDVGNVASATDANGQTTSFTYDWGVLKNTNSPADPISRAINPDGTVASETQGIVTTSFAYDDLGRPTSIGTATPGRAPTTTAYNVSDGSWVSTTVTHGSSSVTTDLDGLGQPTGTTNSAGVRTSTAYDAEGRLMSRSYPFVGSSGPQETYAYDLLGRLTSVNLPEDGRVTYEYGSGGRDIAIHERNFNDDAWRTTTQHWEAFGSPDDGRLASVVDADGETWSYSYNALGQLTRVGMPGGAERTWGYDARGFLSTETLPESGTTVYGHDSVGNVTSKVTAAGTTGFGYDAINRLRSIDAPGTADDVTIDYTSYQRITSTPLVDSTFTYDSANRLVERKDELKGVGGLTARLNYAYDNTDNLIEIANDRTGRRILYGYGTEGRVTSVRQAVGSGTPQDVITGVSYHPSGAINGYTFANGKTFSAGFDGRERPTSWQNGPLNVTLGHDQIGNITGVNDLSGLGHSATFAYDGLDRLSQVWGWQATVQPMAYDPLGNRLTNGYGNSYTYDANTLRLATRTGGPYSGSFVYNGVGSTTSDPAGSSFAYTAAQQLKTATVNVNGTWTTTTYGYDGDGMRTYRQVGTNGEVHYFLHGSGAELSAEYKQAGNALQAVREYISLADQLIASIDATAGAPPSSCNTTFTDGPNLVADVTPVKAVHLTELRAAINCERAWFDLPAYSWTDPTITPDVTLLNHVHVQQLRTALDEAYTAANATHAAYTDPGDLTNVGIKAQHFNELRQFVRDLPAPQPQSTTAIHYYHTDWLGSVRAITDANGAEVSRLEYFPFGEGTPLSGDPMRFTGKELDFETALQYFDARYYSQVNGRFTTADPYVNLDAALVDPQEWNRYGYVLNNPLRLVDPSGLFVCWSESWQEGSTFHSRTECDDSDDRAFERQSRLNWLQNGLDAASVGMDASVILSPFSWIPDVINGVVSLGRRDYIGAGISGLAMVPFLGTVANATHAERTAVRIYSAKALLRRAAEAGALHNFPESFNAIIFRGSREVISDSYVLYKHPGVINGVEGMFEIGVRPSTSGSVEVITHRFFRPNK